MKWMLLYFGYWLFSVGGLMFVRTRTGYKTLTVAGIYWLFAMSCNIEIAIHTCHMVGQGLPVLVARGYWVQFPAFCMGMAAAATLIYYEKAYFRRRTNRETSD